MSGWIFLLLTVFSVPAFGAVPVKEAAPVKKNVSTINAAKKSSSIKGQGLKKNALQSVAVPVTQVKGLRVWPSPENTRLVFDLDGPISYQEITPGTLEKNQVILELHNAKILSDLSKLKLAHTRIKRITSFSQQNNKTRIIIHVEKPLKPNCFTLTPNQQYGHRLVIDLEVMGSEEGETEVETLALNPLPSHQSEHAQAKHIQTEHARENPISNHEKADILAMFAEEGELSAPTPNPKPLPNSNTVQRVNRVNKDTVSNAVHPPPVKTLAPRTRPFIVAIDAGHGGEDPGAVGAHGTREKDVVLAIARYLKTMVDKEPGMQAVLIRSGDYYVGLQDRVLRARKRKADLFISVHADAFQDKRATGASVFTLSERGASSAAARWLAERENRSDLIGGVKLHAKNKVLASVLLDLSQSASKEEGLKAARHVLKSLGGMSKLHRGCVEQAGFAVLKAPDIPSLLVETGFISHPPTERKLKTAEYQKKIASAIMLGIRQYARKTC